MRLADGVAAAPYREEPERDVEGGGGDAADSSPLLLLHHRNSAERPPLGASFAHNDPSVGTSFHQESAALLAHDPAGMPRQQRTQLLLQLASQHIPAFADVPAELPAARLFGPLPSPVAERSCDVAPSPGDERHTALGWRAWPPSPGRQDAPTMPTSSGCRERLDRDRERGAAGGAGAAPAADGGDVPRSVAQRSLVPPAACRGTRQLTFHSAAALAGTAGTANQSHAAKRAHTRRSSLLGSFWQPRSRQPSLVYGTARLVRTDRQLPFNRLAVLWIVLVSFVIAALMCAAERGSGIAFVDLLFVAVNAATATGLSTIDLTQVSQVSIAFIAAGIQLGSSTMLSLIPVVVRLYYLRKTLPSLSEGMSFDLRCYKRIPQTVVEYKALLILLRLVLLYQLVVHVLYAGMMLVYLAASDNARRMVTEPVARGGSGHGVGAWVVFHTLSAYNNAGFSTMPASMARFVAHPFLLWCVMMLVLHGNVLLPVFLRWAVVLLNNRSPKGSSRKIWFRYLLLNGRELYTNLFGSQQTWVLLVTQLLLIIYQVTVTLSISWDDPAFAPHTGAQKFWIAFFEAINTRHAGMTTISLGLDDTHADQGSVGYGKVAPATIVTYLMMMFLAPVPFLAVLKNTMPRGAPPSRAANPTSVLAHSRDLSLRLAAAATQLAAAVENTSVTDVGDDGAGMLHYIDSRALLMTRYPDERVPWAERIGVRTRAVLFHLKLLALKFADGRLMRDMMLLWFAWFVINCSQGRELHGLQHQVFILFEVITAYGNVGLSLGSTRPPFGDDGQPDPKYCGYCSFSHDLGSLPKVVLMVVMVLGRTREMPLVIDGALKIRSAPDEGMLVNEVYRQKSPPKIDIVPAADGPAAGELPPVDRLETDVTAVGPEMERTVATGPACRLVTPNRTVQAQTAEE